MTARLTLTELKITDGDLPPATVSFRPGLNLIVGASNTGKTFIFEAIDYLLGAKDGLRRIPASAGYILASLDIDVSTGPAITIRRAFDGGNVELFEFAEGRAQPPSSVKTLGAKHTPDANTSLSAYLLATIGLLGRQVRKNAQGVKQALSFRNVAHLALVDEERIIQQASPILSGQVVSETADTNAFAFFLTGQDDSSIIHSESSGDRNARLLAEESVVEAILGERRSDLVALSPDASDLTERATRLEAAIAEASSVLVTSQAEISAFEQRRAALVESRATLRSRQLFVEEQLKRLRLLDEYYQTDLARLNTAIEASRAFHSLPEGTCPLCRQTVRGAGQEEPSHEQFESACGQEARKIAELKTSLTLTIEDYSSEDRRLTRQLASDSSQLSNVEARLQQVLLPVVRTARTDLDNLIRVRTNVAQSTTLQAMITSLEERLARIREAKAVRVARITFENRATTSVATELCRVIHDILEAWKYPELGAVTFDSEKADFVIGGQDRANQGKGYRAVAYAAFAIGLMKYCRANDIPHPGFVVLDTPVNPFKGPSATLPGEQAPEDRLTDDVKTAFFEYLASDSSGDQFIIIENESPPPGIAERSNFYEFTKNADVGRYGFFPHRPATTVAPSDGA